MANLSSKCFLGQFDVEVSLVEDSSDVIEVSLANYLHRMLEDRLIVLLGVPEALVVSHAFLVELIVRKSHLHLNSDKKR